MVWELYLSACLFLSGAGIVLSAGDGNAELREMYVLVWSTSHAGCCCRHYGPDNVPASGICSYLSRGGRPDCQIRNGQGPGANMVNAFLFIMSVGVASSCLQVSERRRGNDTKIFVSGIF